MCVCVCGVGNDHAPYDHSPPMPTMPCRNNSGPCIYQYQVSPVLTSGIVDHRHFVCEVHSCTKVGIPGAATP